MAFPTVEATNGVGNNANATSTNVPLPAPGGGILANDIVLVFASIDFVGTQPTAIAGPAGWTELVQGTTGTMRTAVFWKRMAGGETGNINFTHASEGGGWVAFLIRGADTATNPEVTALSSFAAAANAADPPSLTPSWGAADTLWLAAMGLDANNAITAGPTSYSSFTTFRWASSFGGAAAAAYRALNASSENPGNFTHPSAVSQALTVAVRPVTATAQNITGAGAVASAEAVGTPTLKQNVSPSGIASAEAVGAATVTPGAVTVSPPSIGSAEAVGTPIVTRVGDGVISVPSIGSGEAVGTPTISPGAVSVAPTGIPSDQQVPAPALTQNVSPSSIGSGEAFGTPDVEHAALQISPIGIPSEEGFGDVWTSGDGTLSLYPEGIAPGGVGTPTVSDGGPTTIGVIGIASSEAFGASGDRPLVWRAVDSTPSPPTPNPSPGRPAPRAQLVNTATLETYDWAINHSEEQAIRLFHNAELGARNPELGLVRHQSWGDGVSLRLSGAILDRDQHDRFEAFFAECETIGQADPDDQLLFRDPLGSEYVVVVSSYDAKLTRTAQNPRHPDSQVWWQYEIELYVVEARAGALVGALY